MQNQSYQWLKFHKEQLAAIVQEQISVNSSVQFDEQQTNLLKELSLRLKSEDFKVLVMGMFNSGKSTFINALLGKRVLPAKMLPSTAVICEIKYAEKIQCWLYPKKGKYKGAGGRVISDPFEIKTEELKNYVVIDHTGAEGQEEDDAVKESRFDKMLLHWPLGICKNGVEIIDSPGLNDPESHDVITFQYLPKTDAIIYCMSAVNAYTLKDKQTIEELVYMGYKSIIFILTNFDRIQETGDEDEFTRLMFSSLARYTDLGREGILFVNSHGGVLAKEENNPERLEKSGIPQAEGRVEKHLVGQKGRAKLVTGLTQVSGQNLVTERYIENKLALNALDLDKLQQKLQQLQLLLEMAKAKRDLMLKTLELGISDILTHTNDLGRSFLGSLDQKIAQWVNGYSPESKISYNPFQVKRSVKANVEEYVEHIKYKLKQESQLWGQETLYPMITEAIKKMSADTEGLQKAYETVLKDYHIELDTSGIKGNARDQLEPTPFAQISSLLYGAVTGDFLGASLGLTFGFKGLFSSLVTQVAAGVVLGIASLFTPIGIPAIIIGVIVAAITAGAWNFRTVPQRIRDTIIDSVQKALGSISSQDAMIGKIREHLAAELDKLVNTAKDLFARDIAPKEAALKDASDIREKGAGEMDAQNKVLQAGLEQNAVVKKSLESFRLTVNL